MHAPAETGTARFALRRLRDLDATLAAVVERAERLGEATEPGEGDVEESSGPASPDAELGAVLEEAPGVLERLAAGEPPATRREAFVLEAIVQLEGRPAIRIRNGRFDEPPAQWSHLEQHRDAIEAIVGSVGRVQAAPSPHPRWLATAFVVAPGVVMTNRHVAEGIASSDDDVTWTFVPDTQVTLDFAAELPEPGPGTPVVEVLGVHEEYDLALLGLEDEDHPRPRLTLAADEPAELDGGEVFVVGTPVQDGTRNDPVEMKRLFDGLFRVKCLQPGEAAGLVVYEDLDVLGHDCSTLGGNSGSCVVDLATGRVAGLHFRGDYKEINHAVPLWRLAADPLLERHGAAFA